MACVDCNCGRANVCEQFEPEINDDKVVAEAELRSFVDAYKQRPTVFEVVASGVASDGSLLLPFRHTALTAEGAAALRQDFLLAGYTEVAVTEKEQDMPEEVSRLLSALSTYFS